MVSQEFIDYLFYLGIVIMLSLPFLLGYSLYHYYETEEEIQEMDNLDQALYAIDPELLNREKINLTCGQEYIIKIN